MRCRSSSGLSSRGPSVHIEDPPATSPRLNASFRNWSAPTSPGRSRAHPQSGAATPRWLTQALPAALLLWRQRRLDEQIGYPHDREGAPVPVTRNCALLRLDCSLPVALGARPEALCERRETDSHRVQGTAVLTHRRCSAEVPPPWPPVSVISRSWSARRHGYPQRV